MTDICSYPALLTPSAGGVGKGIPYLAWEKKKNNPFYG